MAQNNAVNDLLEDDSQWDLETEIQHEKPRRALVSVSFNAEEMALVSSAADLKHAKLSTYIKEAALGRSRDALSSVVVMNTTVSGTVDSLNGADQESIEEITFTA